MALYTVLYMEIFSPTVSKSCSRIQSRRVQQPTIFNINKNNISHTREEESEEGVVEDHSACEPGFQNYMATVIMNITMYEKKERKRKAGDQAAKNNNWYPPRKCRLTRHTLEIWSGPVGSA